MDQCVRVSRLANLTPTIGHTVSASRQNRTLRPVHLRLGRNEGSSSLDYLVACTVINTIRSTTMKAMKRQAMDTTAR